MNDGLAMLILGVILLAVSCEQVYILRQIRKALDYQSIEAARQSMYLQKLSTHAEVSRLYLQHISRRVRAIHGVTGNDGDDQGKHSSFFAETTVGQDQPG